MEKELYPLAFQPTASCKPWGGSALAEVLGKPFPTAVAIGESWELSDIGDRISVILDGPLAGTSLRELIADCPERMLGRKVAERYGPRFPLLIKFLDIQGKLSVQVHPDDEYAARRHNSLGKAEMWYVLDAAPDAVIYMGFDRDVSAEEFRDACRAGTAGSLLNQIHPRRGDVLFIRPGTVHAAEGGILLCEIQESSDLTLRLFDWGRELDPATRRPMQLEQALSIMDFGPYDPSAFRRAAGSRAVSECLVRCPQFTVHHITLSREVSFDRSGADSFAVYSCIKGKVALSGREVKTGDTLLVPAGCNGITLSPLEEGSELLESVVEL